MRLTRVVNGNKDVPVEGSPPACRVLLDHLCTSGLQFVADLHEERRLSVAWVTSKQDKTHVPFDDRREQLGVSSVGT